MYASREWSLSLRIIHKGVILSIWNDFRETHAGRCVFVRFGGKLGGRGGLCVHVSVQVVRSATTEV